MSLLERVCTGLRVSAGFGLMLLILPGHISPPDPEVGGPQIGSGIINVYVSGAVRKPGVYRFPVGTRAVQAIQTAGGVLPGTPMEHLALTQILQDGQSVHIAAKPTPAPPIVTAHAPAGASQSVGSGRYGASGGGRAAPAPVMLNQASVDALDSLPGIGRKRAEDIVAFRRQHGPFRRIDDLRRIRGVGPKMLAKLRPYLKI
jgi:competence protein ComEA